MNPMKDALKKRKANSINLTIILDQKRPDQGLKPALEIGDDETDDEEENERRLMERAKLATMGK